MPTGIVINVLRGSKAEGHANMKDLIWITIPYIGRLYVQLDTITLSRFGWEVLGGPSHTTEYLLSIGRLRVYLTSSSLVAAEGR